MPGRVVVVGSLNVDLVTRVRRHPAPGETVLGEGLERLPGGKGANQAVAAAAAGASTALVGRVGDDDAGAAYLAGLAERGVDVSAVRPTAGQPTGHALIAVDERGENTIVVIGGANGLVTPEEAMAGTAGADVVLLQLELPLPAVVAAAEAARAAGVRVLLNPSPWQPLPPGLVEAVDVVVVNEHEAEQLGTYGGELVVTLGAAGAEWRSGRERVAVPAPQVDVVDTTGAGDAFAGTLAAALAAGLERQPALARAVTAAAGSVGVAGAQGWSFSSGR